FATELRSSRPAGRRLQARALRVRRGGRSDQLPPPRPRPSSARRSATSGTRPCCGDRPDGRASPRPPLGVTNPARPAWRLVRAVARLLGAGRERDDPWLWPSLLPQLTRAPTPAA